MELREFNNQVHPSPDYPSPYSSQHSLRLRTGPTQDTSAVQFDWSSPPEDAEDSNEPQNLRELPLHMSLKRAVWQVQKMKVPVVSSSWNIKRSKTFHRFCEVAKYILSYFVLWNRGIQRIGGHFGGGVRSYFLFLRFLVILNFLSSLLIAAFVLIPSIVFRSMKFNSTIALTVNLNGTESCLHYDPKPDALMVFYTYFLDLVSGTGFMEYSYLFYGYYNNSKIESNGFSYNIPLAYLLTAAFYFLFCLICMIIRMGGTARLVVVTGGGAVGGYSMLVFTGWDHGLQGDRTTKLKQNNLRHRLQVDLEEERLKKKAASLTLGQTVSLYALRVFLNLVVLILIGAAFYGIAEATQFSQSRKTTGFVGLLLQYLPSMVITASNFVVPLLCDKIALLEKYSPSTTVILALLRAVFLRLVSLGVLLYTLWEQITCKGEINSGNCEPCSYYYDQYKITLFQNCQPATRNFRSTTSNFFFLLVLLFGWMLSSVVLLYSVSKIHPSYGCGPFRIYPAMWEVVPEAVKMLSSSSKEFLFYIGSQKCSIPLFIFSCVLLCYVNVLTSVHGKSVALLRSQCKLEQRDKQFLVRQIEELNATMQNLHREPQQPLRETEPFYHTSPQWNQYNNYAFDPNEDPNPY
ncbi:transmembrane channel-like protein 7 isoform X2 [Carassius auratus]|uniref:Transmembrane channel-like protein 7 isoform X2 n=1 Tax=Carassius auratus TaxID=7957 RepID=A0A6P6NGM5_CARAU|nr:transmembrane channel-like protein 7 isoform X2 [Carassius auratus]